VNVTRPDMTGTAQPPEDDRAYWYAVFVTSVLSTLLLTLLLAAADAANGTWRMP
jgi:hypothetical protein